jgi:hypothetical protein
MKKLTDDIESRLRDEIITGNAKSNANADQKRELDALRATSRSTTAMEEELSTLRESYDKLKRECESEKYRNELLKRVVLEMGGEKEKEAEAEEEEEEEEGVDGGEDVAIPNSVAFLHDDALVPHVVAFIPVDANELFDHLKINVYVNDNADINFLSPFSTNGRGKKLTKKSFEDLINRLRVEPIKKFPPSKIYKQPLKDYQFWGPNDSGVSWEKIAREHLGLSDA